MRYILNIIFIFLGRLFPLSDKKSSQRFGLEIVVGKFGGGKSYYCVRKVVQMLRKDNYVVYSNMLLNFDYVHLNSVSDLNVALSNFDEKRIIILDEINAVFKAQLKSDVSRETFLLLTQIRKGQGCTVFAVSQDYSLLSSEFRKLATTVVELSSHGRAVIARRMKQQDYEILHQAGGINKEKATKMYYEYIRYFLSKKIFEKYDSYGFVKPLTLD